MEFRQLQEKILDRLQDASNLEEFGDLTKSLSVQEFRSLEFLNTTEPPMMRELAEHLRLAVNSVTEIVDSLEQRGLAERRRDDNDRRITRICLTKKGAEASATIHSGFLFIYRRYLSALTEAEQETLLAIYRKIATVDRPSKLPSNCR